MSKPIRYIAAPDGHSRVVIYERSDGGFEYSLEKFFVNDLPGYDFYREYWAPVYRPDVFESASEAMQAAAEEFSWARLGS